MKKIALILVAAIFFIACDKHEHIQFGGENGLAFKSTTATAIILPVTGNTETVDVEITTLSDFDRTFDITADVANSTLPAANYTLGTVTIPANSYQGTMDVTYNDAGLTDLVVYTLKVDITVPAGISVIRTGGDSVTIDVLKKIICNDLELTINFDNYGSETTWDVKDGNDVIVAQGGPYSDGGAGTSTTENFNLADGCYTFTIYDSFGDGLYDGNTTGGYDLECSIINHASGTGNFGAFDSTEFCVND